MNTTATPEPFRTSGQIMDLLSISRGTLHRWMEQGMPVHGRGSGRYLRFRWSEVCSWLDSMDSKPTSPHTSTQEITG